MILLDNTVLSNFALVNRPELIRVAFTNDVGVTENVLDELKRGMTLGRLPNYHWEWLQSVNMTEVEQHQFAQFHHQLGAGEASCLAVALHRGWKIATDDRDARKWAIRLQIPCTGTLGILGILLACNQITLDEGNEYLHHMINAGYHSPIDSLNELVHRA